MKSVLISVFASFALFATAGCAVSAEDAPPGLEPVATEAKPVLVGSSLFDPPSCAQQPTQCNGMHCCPANYAMTGAHFGQNTFRCTYMYGALETPTTCYRDTSTFRSIQGQRVKGCPVGYYMKGYHEGQNATTCCPYSPTNASSSWTFDGFGSAPTQATDAHLISPWPFAGVCKSGTMHVCAGSGVMEGVNVGSNYYLCGN